MELNLKKAKLNAFEALQKGALEQCCVEKIRIEVKKALNFDTQMEIEVIYDKNFILNFIAAKRSKEKGSLKKALRSEL